MIYRWIMLSHNRSYLKFTGKLFKKLDIKPKVRTLCCVMLSIIVSHLEITIRYDYLASSNHCNIEIRHTLPCLSQMYHTFDLKTIFVYIREVVTLFDVITFKTHFSTQHNTLLQRIVRSITYHSIL